MKLSILLLVTVLLVAAVLASGCVSQPGNGTTPVRQNTVAIKNFAFDPTSIIVAKGTTVTWTNNDADPHIIASDPHPTHTDLPGLESESLSQNQSYSFTFTSAGTFGYHCHLHPYMKGTVIVEE